MAGKRLTQKEKKLNREIKKQLQGEGVIPPDKPRLNRKKFIEEAMEEWEKEGEVYDLLEAVFVMTGHTDCYGRPTLEAVGAAKCLKIVVRKNRVRKRATAGGRETYTLKEVYEEIKDVLNA